MMLTLPPVIDRLDWMSADPAGYWAFCRHLTRQHARKSLGLKRLPAHRAEREHIKCPVTR